MYMYIYIRMYIHMSRVWWILQTTPRKLLPDALLSSPRNALSKFQAPRSWAHFSRWSFEKLFSGSGVDDEQRVDSACSNALTECQC